MYPCWCNKRRDSAVSWCGLSESVLRGEQMQRMGSRESARCDRQSSAILEVLEGRRLLSKASISGVVFNDLNADGDRDAHENGIAGIRVYIDRDNDHRLDKNE